MEHLKSKKNETVRTEKPKAYSLLNTQTANNNENTQIIESYPENSLKKDSAYKSNYSKITADDKTGKRTVYLSNIKAKSSLNKDKQVPLIKPTAHQWSSTSSSKKNPNILNKQQVKARQSSLDNPIDCSQQNCPSNNHITNSQVNEKQSSSDNTTDCFQKNFSLNYIKTSNKKEDAESPSAPFPGLDLTYKHTADNITEGNIEGPTDCSLSTGVSSNEHLNNKETIKLGSNYNSGTKQNTFTDTKKQTKFLKIDATKNSQLKSTNPVISQQLSSSDFQIKNNSKNALLYKPKRFIDCATNKSISERNEALYKIEGKNKSSQPILNNTDIKNSRTRYYKNLRIKVDDILYDDFPNFNTGTNPINPINSGKLNKMTSFNVKTPEEYAILIENLKKNEKITNGEVNIENVLCDRNGKVSIICESIEHKGILKEILKEQNYSSTDVIIKEFKFAIHGIPKSADPKEVFDELSKRDPKRFNPENLTYCEKFPIDAAKNILTFKCKHQHAKEFVIKPYIFYGLKKYRVRNFIDLVQCFTCSKFGHKSNKCPVDDQPNRHKCPNCAGNHILKACKTIYTPNCTNCHSLKLQDSGHSSWDVRCPYRRAYIAKRRQIIDTNGRRHANLPY